MKFEQLYTFMAGGYLLHYIMECYSTFFSKNNKCKNYVVANKNSTILKSILLSISIDLSKGIS